MAQPPPNLATILIGGSGLLGLATYVTKSLIDRKDADITSLIRANNDLKEKVAEERSKTHTMLSELAETLKDIDAGKLDAVGAIRLREAVRLAEQFSGDLERETNDCQRAADWVAVCKKSWVQVMSSVAAKRYPKLVPLHKRKAFRRDISKYLDWVCACLYKGGTRTIPLSQFVACPVVSSSHPYVAAITQVLELGEWGELTAQQRAYLQEVLTRLTEQIQNSFND